MGGNTHEQPATVASDATENTTTTQDPAEGKANVENQSESVNAVNEIAPETENPTAQGETVSDSSGTQGETVADANPQANQG